MARWEMNEHADLGCTTIGTDYKEAVSLLDQTDDGVAGEAKWKAIGVRASYFLEAVKPIGAWRLLYAGDLPPVLRRRQWDNAGIVLH